MADLSALWTRFHDHICNDLPCVLSRRADLLSRESNAYLDYGIFLVGGLLADQGKSAAADFQLPLCWFDWGRAEGNELLAAELLYDRDSEETQFQESHGKLNTDQAAAFTAITAAIAADPRRACFFLQGLAGTSKTFL